MPLGPYATRRGAGSRAEVAGRVSVILRRVRRGKNEFALPLRSRKRQCREWHDDENHASLAPQSAPNRVPVSALDNLARSSSAACLAEPGRPVLCLWVMWKANTWPVQLRREATRLRATLPDAARCANSLDGPAGCAPQRNANESCVSSLAAKSRSSRPKPADRALALCSSPGDDPHLVAEAWYGVPCPSTPVSTRVLRPASKRSPRT